MTMGLSERNNSLFRAWDPTAPIEELKKLLEEDFEVGSMGLETNLTILDH